MVDYTSGIIYTASLRPPPARSSAPGLTQPRASRGDVSLEPRVESIGRARGTVPAPTAPGTSGVRALELTFGRATSAGLALDPYHAEEVLERTLSVPEGSGPMGRRAVAARGRQGLELSLAVLEGRVEVHVHRRSR